MSLQSFFYDQQIRRYIIQFIRMVSNFQVEFGRDRNGAIALQRVPVIYGDSSRQAATIIKENSENIMNTVPAMAVYVSGLTYDRNRLQNPTYVGKMHVRERYYDPNTGEYSTTQGDVLNIDRLMPVPYKLTLKLDIWTSNTEQKLQLLEQLCILFNPALEIQSTDNYIDWTSLSYVLLTDISWSNRSVPTGTEESIDIASLTFELPIWVSAPAKVKQLGVVAKIINSVGDPNQEPLDFYEQHLTFDNYQVLFQGNTLKLLKANDITASDTMIEAELRFRTAHSWQALVTQFGVIRNGLSKIRLLQRNGSEVVGTIALHPIDDTLLLYTPDIDTLPTNTLPPINAIINPQNIDVDSNLLNPTVGTRYLLLHAVGHPDNQESAPAWNNDTFPQLIANANDIVEFNGVYWVVSFDSRNELSVEYVTNLTTGVQYKWSEGSWTKSVEGRYDNSRWSLTL